jgi:two-component system, NtrC family, nitrogen regulation response regulator NtrX
MKGRILVVDDEKNIGRSMEMIHEGEGHEVVSVSAGDQALVMLKKHGDFDLVYLDIQMPGMDGIETLEKIRESWPDLAVVMISGHATVEKAVEALKLGAVDFLEKGFSKSRLLTTTNAVMERVSLRRENRELRRSLEGEGEIIGESDALQMVRDQIARVAPSHARVLITGESGTGKELVARAIHQSSDRARQPFVRVNCAAIPETLIESELFGVMKGAYTGADRDRDGKFTAADGGTLFLDEIADMSLKTQTKVLRALQEGEIEKVGSGNTEKVDVRVLAATNKNLETAVAEGEFREDLYYRLAVVPVHLPPLRARKEDIPLLVESFQKEFESKYGLAAKQIEAEAMDHLARYAWPGNIRELRNQVERLLIMGGDRIGPSDLPPELSDAKTPAKFKSLGEGLAALAGTLLGQPLGESKHLFERELIRLALERRHGNVTRAAQDLGVERTNLHKKIRRLGLSEAEED